MEHVHDSSEKYHANKDKKKKKKQWGWDAGVKAG